MFIVVHHLAHARPFIELAYLRPTQAVRPSLFVPDEFYGAARLWSVSAGVRLGIGAAHARMGRYGAAAPVEASVH